MVVREHVRLAEKTGPKKATMPLSVSLSHGFENQENIRLPRPADQRLTPDRVLGLQSTIGNAEVRRKIKAYRIQGKPGGDLGVDDLGEAVKYDKGRGLSVDTIRGIQRLVGVPDDGQFGPQSVRAIARWQAQNGLESDGKIGPQTLNRLIPPTTTTESTAPANTGSSAAATNALPAVQTPATDQGGGILDTIVTTGKSAW